MKVKTTLYTNSYYESFYTFVLFNVGSIICSAHIQTEINFFPPIRETFLDSIHRMEEWLDGWDFLEYAKFMEYGTNLLS